VHWPPPLLTFQDARPRASYAATGKFPDSASDPVIALTGNRITRSPIRPAGASTHTGNPGAGDPLQPRIGTRRSSGSAWHRYSLAGMPLTYLTAGSARLSTRASRSWLPGSRGYGPADERPTDRIFIHGRSRGECPHLPPSARI
jgi:hypothetical protein